MVTLHRQSYFAPDITFSGQRLSPSALPVAVLGPQAQVPSCQADLWARFTPGTPLGARQRSGTKVRSHRVRVSRPFRYCPLCPESRAPLRAPDCFRALWAVPGAPGTQIPEITSPAPSPSSPDPSTPRPTVLLALVPPGLRGPWRPRPWQQKVDDLDDLPPRRPQKAAPTRLKPAGSPLTLLTLRLPAGPTPGPTSWVSADQNDPSRKEHDRLWCP